MTSSKRAARAAVVVGALAVLAIPAAVGVSRWGPRGTTLLHALYGGVPAAVALGLIAWICARRARFVLARSVSVDRAGPVRLGRFLAYAGLYLGVTGALALAFYAVLQHAQ
jgi:hypothetical protein